MHRLLDRVKRLLGAISTRYIYMSALQSAVASLFLFVVVVVVVVVVVIELRL